MKKEEQSKLTKFLNYIISRAFRDVVKNILITIAVIFAVVMVYFYAVDYSAKKIEESTGVNVLREIASGQANGNSQETEIKLSEINVSAFSEQETLKVMLEFSTLPDTVAFVKISGNGQTINESSSVAAGSHNFVLELGGNSYNSLFVYSVTVHDGAGNEKKVMGELKTPEKKNAKIAIG